MALFLFILLHIAVNKDSDSCTGLIQSFNELNNLVLPVPLCYSRGLLMVCLTNVPCK